MKTVELTWIDSRLIEGWEYVDDINEDATLVKTQGWLLKETNEVFVVASSIGDDGAQACGITIIPKCCVINKNIDE